MPDICVDQIAANPAQPRKTFENIDELAQSLLEHKQLTPIQVRRHGDGYQVVTGERRWRAAKHAGLTHLRAEILEVTDEEAFQIALLENLQRDDLTVIEEAQAYERLSAEGKTQDEIAQLISKSQQYVADRLSLLRLDEFVQEMVTARVVSPSVGRELAKLEPQQQVEVADRATREKLTVRKVQHAVRESAKNSQREDSEARGLDQVVTQVVNHWPALEPFASGLRSGDIWMLNHHSWTGDPNKFTPRLGLRLSSTFAGQPWPWPRYSGEVLGQSPVADPEEDERVRETVPLFSPREWEEWRSFEPREALADLIPTDGIEWRISDLTRNVPWQLYRRTYCEEYGGFLTKDDDFVKQGWGSWAVVEFNDGSGDRTERRVFVHDHLNRWLVKEARSSISSDAVNPYELQSLGTWRVFQDEMGRFEDQLVHYSTDEILEFLKQDAEDLREYKELCERHPEDALLWWLQRFVPIWPDGFGDGKVTLPRSADGGVDYDLWSDHKQEVDARSRLVRDPSW